MRALTKGLVVAAAAISAAVFLFAVDLESAASEPTETAQAEASGAASSAPVAFPSSGTRRTKAIWQDPLGVSLVIAGVVAGTVIVVRERRRSGSMDTVDA